MAKCNVGELQTTIGKYNLQIGAHGDDGCLPKMDTCPTGFPKKKGHMPKISS